MNPTEVLASVITIEAIPRLFKTALWDKFASEEMAG